MLKQLTSSIFLVRYNLQWELLLVHHKKYGRWMVPGGHVERDESPVEAILRETKEETGIVPILFSFIHKTPKVVFSPDKWILPPEFVLEEVVHSGIEETTHIHIDCLFFAYTDRKVRLNSHEHRNLSWYRRDSLPHSAMFSSTVYIADLLFDRLPSGVKNLREKAEDWIQT